jgi:hypothetical protein
MSWQKKACKPGCAGVEGVAIAAELTPEQTRAQDEAFVSQCSLTSLHDRLTLCWPTPPDAPPSPKRSYRSQYVYQGWYDMRDPSCWEQWSEFDWVLRLVDFSGLRAVLAQLLGWQSGGGWKPFDPLALFLLTTWQLVNRWNRAEPLRKLRPQLAPATCANYAMPTMLSALVYGKRSFPPRAACATF